MFEADGILYKYSTKYHISFFYQNTFSLYLFLAHKILLIQTTYSQEFFIELVKLSFLIILIPYWDTYSQVNAAEAIFMRYYR
jgi:hypothetical protein